MRVFQSFPNSTSDPSLLLMGVASIGMSSLAKIVSEWPDCRMAEGVEFHSENSIALMQADIASTNVGCSSWLDMVARMPCANEICVPRSRTGSRSIASPENIGET